MDLKLRILNRTRQGLDVFHHYLGVKFFPNRNFKNPLYNDTRASCSIYLSKKSGIYMMKDFGDMEYSGDCFWLVGRILGLDMKNDFKQILRRINEDMHLCIPMDSADDRNSNRQDNSTAPKHNTFVNTVPKNCDDSKTNEQPPPQPNVRLVFKEFSEDELRFWSRYGIKADTLKRFKVRSAKSLTGVTKEGKTYRICSQPTEPMFVYHTIDDAVKVLHAEKQVEIYVCTPPER